MNNLAELEQLIGYKFSNIDYLIQSLSHSSYANEHNCSSNETMEFLGDSVLDLCMAHYLFLNEAITEGAMTKKRATYVCEEALSLYATKLGLGKFLKLGVGEDANGGRERAALLADAFEAVLGAVFLDGGFDKCYDVIKKIVIPFLELVDVSDYKSRLQEFLAADRRAIFYKLLREDGPPHDKTYEFAAVLDDNIVMGVGIGKTKKDAEQNAAKQALNKIAK